MVFGSCTLPPGHTRRARICDATRNGRRQIANNRVRRPLQEAGNILQPIGCNNQFTCNTIGSNFGDYDSVDRIESY